MLRLRSQSNHAFVLPIHYSYAKASSTNSWKSSLEESIQANEASKENDNLTARQDEAREDERKQLKADLKQAKKDKRNVEKSLEAARNG